MIPHDSYDLGHVSWDSGFFTVTDSVYVQVKLNYAANVMLMDKYNYERYRDDDSFEYYGGYATKSPCNIEIPYSDRWFLIIDNGGDDMDGIDASVCVREVTHDRF